jgi:hypothetical protein
MVATLISILLRISLLFCITAYAANYVLEADTSSYGYGLINSPSGEQYYNAVDGNIGSKYLNFYKTGAGITVGFANARIMRRLIMTTANDATERDPMTINIYGSSTYNGAKTLIQSNVATNLSTNRYTASTIDFENNTSYQFYTIEITSVRNPTYANSFQFSEVVFYYDTQYVANAAPTYSSGITAAQQTRKNSETTQRLNQSSNEIQIEQIGDNNNITIRQGVTISGKNRIELYSNGDYNTLNLNQGYTTSGTVSVGDSNNHYLNLNLIGSNNTVTKQQTGTNNFLETTISGNSNNVTNIQQGNSSKILFQNISGNSNVVTTNQKDSGQHYLDIKLTGGGHNVGVTQEGTGNHAATIDFTNSGGASSLNLNQSGSTNQIYSIQQSCANPAGCSTTITQP